MSTHQALLLDIEYADIKPSESKKSDQQIIFIDSSLYQFSHVQCRALHQLKFGFVFLRFYIHSCDE